MVGRGRGETKVTPSNRRDETADQNNSTDGAGRGEARRASLVINVRSLFALPYLFAVRDGCRIRKE